MRMVITITIEKTRPRTDGALLRAPRLQMGGLTEGRAVCRQNGRAAGSAFRRREFSSGLASALPLH
jgi:hypothetical protein